MKCCHGVEICGCWWRITFWVILIGEEKRPSGRGRMFPITAMGFSAESHVLWESLKVMAVICHNKSPHAVGIPKGRGCDMSQ